MNKGIFDSIVYKSFFQIASVSDGYTIDDFLNETVRQTAQYVSEPDNWPGYFYGEIVNRIIINFDKDSDGWGIRNFDSQFLKNRGDVTWDKINKEIYERHLIKIP